MFSRASTARICNDFILSTPITYLKPQSNNKYEHWTSFILLHGSRQESNYFVVLCLISWIILNVIFSELLLYYSKSIVNQNREIHPKYQIFLLLFVSQYFNSYLELNIQSSSLSLSVIFISMNRNRYLYGFILLCLRVVCIYTRIVKKRTGFCVWINKHNNNLWQDLYEIYQRSDKNMCVKNKIPLNKFRYFEISIHCYYWREHCTKQAKFYAT